jgi:hypothetical protein
MSTVDLLADARWRRSSFSGGGANGAGDCVEAAHLPDGSVAVRDSKSPHTGTVMLGRDELTAWLNHLKSGQLD